MTHRNTTPATRVARKRMYHGNSRSAYADGETYGISGGYPSSTPYTESFYPNAPSPFDGMAPVKPRATPYTEYPLRCSINNSTGTIRCINNESRGGLYGETGSFGDAQPVVYALGVSRRADEDGALPFQPPPTWAGDPTGPVVLQSYVTSPVPRDNFNYVVGRNVVIPERADSPLNRILTRQALGPWQLVGAAITDLPNHTASKDRTMLVYAQSVDSARNRYNYRIVDNNNVPLDIAEKVHWKDDHAPLHVPGYPHKYQLKLYGTFRG